MSRPRVAVIGTGSAGLAAAYALRTECHVTMYEAEARAGGHADTVDVTVDGQSVPVDMGFIVFNDRNYPTLLRLFAELGIDSFDSTMGFAVSLDEGRLEYAGGSVGQIFAQKRNLARRRFWRMLADIPRFYREAAALLEGPPGDESLGAFLSRRKFSAGFVEDHLLPMGAAIWSAPVEKMKDFPAVAFARFFANHGLLSLRDRPVWRSVRGGSRAYVRKVLAAVERAGTVRLGAPVSRIARVAGRVAVAALGETALYDKVVLACHADQALALLDSPRPAEAAVLGAFAFSRNRAILHSDVSLMPRRFKVWSAWNYLARSDGAGNDPVGVTYWMNTLQSLPTRTPMLVSLNPPHRPHPDMVHAVRSYRHPLFDAAALAAQQRLPEISGPDIWYAGAWTGWGFHEDGMRSGLRAAEGVLAAAARAAA